MRKITIFLVFFLLLAGVRLYAGASLRPTVLLTLPDVVLERGQTVDLPVHVSQTGEYYGFQLALRFDPALLAVEAVEARALADQGDLMHAARPDGRVALSWSDATPHRLDAASPLFVVRVRALTGTPVREAVKVQADGLRPEIYNAAQETQLLELGFAAATPDGAHLAVGLPQPNPTAAGTAIFVYLPAARTVTLELTDAVGRLVHRSERPLDAGVHRLEIPAEAFAGAGVYVWRVLAGEEAVSGKVAKQ